MTARKTNTKTAGVSFGKITSATSKCTVDYGGEAIEVEFIKGFWTAKTESAYFEGDERYSVKNVALVKQAAIKWNLFDDNGDMVPITQENLEMLDSYLVDAMVNAMIKAVNPKAQSSQD